MGGAGSNPKAGAQTRPAISRSSSSQIDPHQHSTANEPVSVQTKQRRNQPIL